MPLIDCLGKAKEVISEKDRQRMMSRSEALKKEGFDSDAAERKAVQEYVSEKHKDLHDQLNKLKTKAGLKAADYKPLAFKEPQDQPTLKDIEGLPVFYKGEPARVHKDGQSYVAEITGKNREYELGNVDEIGGKPISEFGIRHEKSVVSANESGDIVVRDSVYKNRYSNPLAAITYDSEGNVKSVTLETEGGEKRNFRGGVAEDIAYQIHLKEATKHVDTHVGNPEVITDHDIEQAGHEALKELNTTEHGEQPNDNVGTESNAQPDHAGTDEGNADQSAAGVSQNDAAAPNPEPTPEATEPDSTRPTEAERGATEANPEIGISHDLRTERTDATGQEAPVRGKGISAGDSVERGKQLMSEGADPEKIAADFKQNGKISADDMAVVRAHYNKLVKATEDAVAKHGVNSPQDKAAKKAESAWYNEVVKPMQTVWHEVGMAQQGQTDIETGSLTGIRRAFEQQNGREMKAQEMERARVLAEENNRLAKEVEALAKKLTDHIDESIKTKRDSERKTYTEKAKTVADQFRKLKTKPFTFQDEKGNVIEVQKMGIGWNDLVELGAKAIEKTGEIADGIAAVVDKVKDTDWYQKLSEGDKSRFASQLQEHYLSNSDEAKKIVRLEKKLEDIQNGKVNQRGPTSKDSPEAKRLKEEIEEAKAKMGLTKSRMVSPEEQQQGKEQSIADLAATLNGRKGKDYTKEEAKQLWDHAKKEYIDKGSDFDDMITNVAMDLGIKPEDVRDAIVMPKNVRVISDEMYKKMDQRAKAKRMAEDWIKSAGQNPMGKVLKSIPDFFFGLKVFGHGTVGMITHAGMNIFDPVEWKRYWPMFFNQFKLAYNPTYHAQAMADHVRDPQYYLWKRAGLAIDPSERYDDYQFVTKIFNKMGKVGEWLSAGDRGFNALKLYRLQRAKALYEKTSQLEKADPNTAKMIATLVNHSTGTSKLPLPEAANVAFFAPRLEAARWAKLVTDPAKAVSTFTNWGKASAAEKVQAKIVAKRAGRIMSVYVGSLLANQALLSLAGSKQSINFTNPSQSDWLKFKVDGHTIDMTGGMVSTLSFLANMAKIAFESEHDLPANKTRKDMLVDKSWTYITGKASPFASTIKDIATHHDFEGNTMPFYNDAPARGKDKLTWAQYILGGQAPIPVTEGFNDFQKQMEQDGAPKSKARAITESVITAALVGGTGVHVGNEPKEPINNVRGELQKMIQSGQNPSDDQWAKARIAPNERHQFAREAMMPDNVREFYKLKPFEQVMQWDKMDDKQREDIKSSGAMHFKGIHNLEYTDPATYKKYKKAIEDIFN